MTHAQVRTHFQNPTYSQELKALSNDALFLRAKNDIKHETAATLQVLHTLREIERRRAFALKSYPSLFEFCVDYLGYKKGAAYRRILAMRALKEMPEVEEKVQSGVLSLMTLSQAQGYFKERARVQKPLPIEDKREILKNLENKSSRDTEKYFLKVMPQDHAKEKLKPLDEDNYSWQVTLPQRVKDKITKLQHLLGKEGNNLENMDVLERALDMAIKEKEKEKEKEVPALGKIKQLWLKDQARCTFIDPLTQVRCPQTTKLEIDHIRPRALGGHSEIQNLRLLCKSHSQLEAIKIFGLQKMEPYLN